jgi:hypothetical protein
MTLGAVRHAGRTARRVDLAERRRREFRDVRHPLIPDLRVERVIICPSGIHVVTSLPVGTGVPGRPVADPVFVAAGQAAADVVAALLPQRYRGRVRPVLCRVDEVAMAELVDDVLVTSAGTLEHIVSSSPVVLSTSEVNDVALRLDARLEPFPITHVQRRRSWRRCGLVGGLVAAASAVGAVAVLLTEQVGALPLPW